MHLIHVTWSPMQIMGQQQQQYSLPTQLQPLPATQLQ
jgi:hypothetical protein